MSLGLWRDALELVGSFTRSNQLLQLHARGRIDESTLLYHLHAIEDRVAHLRSRHPLLDLLVTLLGQPVLLQRPVCWLVVLAGVSMLVRCVRMG